jgi:hypothetical protein
MQPMGPYVYLSADTVELTTLLCRCSPALTDGWFTEVCYQLQQLESPEQLGLGDGIPECLGLPTDPRWLEKTLRLPSFEEETTLPGPSARPSQA